MHKPPRVGPIFIATPDFLTSPSHLPTTMKQNRMETFCLLRLRPRLDRVLGAWVFSLQYDFTTQNKASFKEKDLPPTNASLTP